MRELEKEEKNIIIVMNCGEISYKIVKLDRENQTFV